MDYDLKLLKQGFKELSEALKLLKTIVDDIAEYTLEQDKKTMELLGKLESQIKNLK